MKKIFNTLILFFAIAGNGYSQQKWEIQPLPVESRWAKEVNPKNVLNEYPRPQMVRRNWKNLNGLWKYAITKKDAPEPTIFDGKILVPFPVESALSGVQKALLPDQNIWYKRSFKNPGLDNGERLLLQFGAVDYQCWVFVNGKEVGNHTGGYENFSMDITGDLKEGTNELVVKVYDPTDNGPNPHGKQTLNPANIYYTASSGIWQTVWMEKVPTSYITGLKTTPDVDNALLNIDVYTSNKAADLSLEVMVKSKGKTISAVTKNLGEAIHLPVVKPRLWSPQDPFLYDLIVKLKQGNKTIDEVNSYFGMRKIAVQKDEKGVERIFLNNKPIFNLGVLDQGFWPAGLYTAPTDEALAFDIRASKAMGFNTIRKHIKIEPARWYYHADKIGILVWQDFVQPPFDLTPEAKAEFEKEIQATMDQLHDYPCIITWDLFNERWGAYDQKRLTKWVKDYDPERLVNGHSGELLYVNDQLREPSDSPWIYSDMADVHSYPEPRIPVAVSGKARVLGEFGGIGVSVPGHEWNDLKGWGYVEVSPADFAEKYGMMVKQLKKLREQGLSASIYTQITDVEGEENGLLTYDRSLIKIPRSRIREINSELVPETKAFDGEAMLFSAKNIDVNDNDSRYPEMLKQFERGKHDSVFLRRLTLMAIRQKDQPTVTQVGSSFINNMKQPFSKSNLIFIMQLTRTSKDKSFQILRTYPKRVDALLGNNRAEGKIKSVIEAEEITPYLKANTSPDWDAIQARVTQKYDSLGETFVLGKRMIYYGFESKDWKNYGKYYKLYFEKALKNPDYYINNMSWLIFQQVDDPKILEFAVNVMKYSIGVWYQTDPVSWDTYANLLYKTGKTTEAIEWEEKAVEMKKGQPDENLYTEALDKMKKGQPTWN